MLPYLHRAGAVILNAVKDLIVVILNAVKDLIAVILSKAKDLAVKDLIAVILNTVKDLRAKNPEVLDPADKFVQIRVIRGEEK